MRDRYAVRRSDPEVEGNWFEEHGEYGEYGLLMSLALDDLLDAEGEARLQSHLEGCPSCARQWQLWCKLDGLMASAPLLAPQAGFLGRFAERLNRQESRRHRWLGISLGLLAVVTWGAGLICSMVVISVLLWNQSAALGDLVHWAAYLWVGIRALGTPIWDLVLGVVESPSAVSLLMGYALFTVLILSVWTRFLQRTTTPIDAPSSPS